MRKAILLILILSSTILFSACDIPLYTQYRVKKYLELTEANFNESKSEFNKIKDAIFVENPKYKETKDIVPAAFDEINSFSQTLNSKKPSGQTEALHQNLEDYYQNLCDFAKEIKLMMNFLYLMEKTSDDFFTSADKLPKDFNASVAKLIQEFTQSKKEYQDQLKALEDQEVPEYFYQARIALISVLEAYVDYLDSVIKGLKEKNSYYFDIDQFVKQMDDGTLKFTSQLEVIERRGDFNKKIEDLTQKQTEISQQTQGLKERYKIK